MDPQAPTLVPEKPNFPEPPKPKDNHWITIASMAVFVLLSLAAVAFLYYQNQQLKSMLATYQFQPSPTPASTPDPTANWKTYMGSFAKNEYSFKYPESLSPLVTDNGLVNFFEDQTDLLSCEKVYKGLQEKSLQNDPCAKNLFNISVTIYTKQDFEKSGINRMSGTSSPALDPKTYTDSKGRKWQTDLVLLGGFNFAGITDINEKVYIIGIQSGFGKNWEADGGQEFRNLTNQILSTFKFLDASPIPTAKACTQEAKLCPDGSYVGRTGANCEFAPCP